MADYTIRTFEDTDVALPASHTDKGDIDEAVQALLQAAWPRYNASLQALNDGDIPDALREADAAFRMMPYSAVISEYSLTLTIQHGDFARAEQLLSWGEETGLNASWPNYDAMLDDAISRWNLFVDDAEALRTAYQSENVSPSYREALLLARRSEQSDTTPLTDAERRHLRSFQLLSPEDSTPASEASPSSGTGFPVMPSIVSGAVGLLLGAVVLSVLGPDVLDPDPPDSEEGSSGPNVETTTSIDRDDKSDEPDTNGLSGDARKLVQANLHILQDRPIEAHKQLQELSEAEEEIQELLPDLREATDEALFEHGIAAYRDENYTTVLGALQRIEDETVGIPQERWYYQGMAAAELGNENDAIAAFKTLQDYLTTTSAYPHFDAQAAYKLVQLLPREEAHSHAKRIANQYGDTIYNNSVVQATLNNSQ